MIDSAIIGAPLPELRDLAERLNQRPFRIGFFGRMKSGKSSLVNSLLGVNVLPVKSVTTTATRTDIRRGDSEFAEVSDDKGAVTRVSVNEARSRIVHVQGKHNETRMVSLTLTNISLPLYVTYTDTPGIDDDPVLTDIAESVIDETDVAVLVLDATRFISASERQFAASLNERLGGNVVFAVNKTDLVDEMSEVEATANVYLRTFGNELVGNPTVLYTSAPVNAAGNVTALSDVLKSLTRGQVDKLRNRAGRVLLVRQTEEALSGLIAARAKKVSQLRNAESDRLIGYISRINKGRSRLDDLVRPFADTCLDIVADEGGTLTKRNMVYCLNTVAEVYIGKFNDNLQALRSEFGVGGKERVSALQQVSESDLASWGIGAFFNETANHAVFSEILNVQQRKLVRNIETAFYNEERKISELAEGTLNQESNGLLLDIDKKILDCECFLANLKNGGN